MNDKLKNTLTEIELARQHYEWALRFEGYCGGDPRSGDFDKFLEEFNVPFESLFPEGHLIFNQPFSAGEMIRHSRINVSIAFGVLAQVIDRGYDEAGIKSKYPPANQEECLRVYFEQIRNLFQHTMGAPIWNIFHKKRIKIQLKPPSKLLEIDFASLNEKEFEYSQIGGIAVFLELCNEAVKHLAKTIGQS